jgi:hypothetical protein
MEAEKSSVLGHLVDVSGDSFVAKLLTERDGQPAEKMIGLDKVRIGQVGSYLMVKQSGNELLCTVESMWIEQVANNRGKGSLSVASPTTRPPAQNCTSFPPGTWKEYFLISVMCITRSAN